MSNDEIFMAFFSEEVININIYTFLLDFTLTILSALLITFLFNKYSKTLSNRDNFSKIFILLAVTTMMVISIIKSSIALSLGLVGALSIIRFRTAIKDPEELVYIFLVMGVGLGFGSGNRALALIFVLLVSIVIIFKSYFNKNISSESSLFLFVSFSMNVNSNMVIDILNKYASYIELNRISLNNENSEFIFNFKIKDLKSLDKVKDELINIDKNVEITFTENKGLFN
jgi:hypothetical protein